MMPHLEFEGKSVEKAFQKACEELKIPKEKLKYDIISYGATGIFGLVGIKKAKIRVTLPTSSSEDKKSEYNNELKEKVKKFESSTQQGLLDVKVISSITDEALILGKNVLQRIIDLITIDAEISFEQKADKILFYIKGGNVAILIGKHGQTLEAMQYLVEKIINKNSEHRIRIQIDIEGYLEKRKKYLKELARRLGEKAKHSGKPMKIGKMNAYDRRIVHCELMDDSGLKTQSVGNGFLKNLLIFPRNKYPRKRKL